MTINCKLCNREITNLNHSEQEGVCFDCLSKSDKRYAIRKAILPTDQERKELVGWLAGQVET